MAQERIGRYQIIEEIASGTQGAVYEALDLTTNQMVALKVLHATVSGHVEYVERFEREARIMASIDHPNVVKVLDVGREGDRYWLALELLPGSLARILDATQRLPIEGAVRFAVQIADGLSAAHAAGVTHRDIKPQNVLIDTDGVAKVTDFGIARSESMASMTGTGATLGTPYYMSPEQAAGGRADARSDVYALGCVMYQMLAGETVFDATTPLAVLRMHIDEQPRPIRSLREDVPPAVAGVVMRALRKNPEDRMQTASDMATALRDAVPRIVESTLPPEKSPTPRPTPKREAPATEAPPSDRPPYSPPPPTRPTLGDRLAEPGRSGRRVVMGMAALIAIGVVIAIITFSLFAGDDGTPSVVSKTEDDPPPAVLLSATPTAPPRPAVEAVPTPEPELIGLEWEAMSGAITQKVPAGTLVMLTISATGMDGRSVEVSILEDDQPLGYELVEVKDATFHNGRAAVLWKTLFIDDGILASTREPEFVFEVFGAISPQLIVTESVVPTPTPSPVPTATPLPTLTPTPRPPATPTAPPTPKSTSIPSPTATPPPAADTGYTAVLDGGFYTTLTVYSDQQDCVLGGTDQRLGEGLVVEVVASACNDELRLFRLDNGNLWWARKPQVDKQ